VLTVAKYSIPEGYENLLKDFEDEISKDGTIAEKDETMTVDPCDRINDCKLFYLISEDEDSDIERREYRK